MSNRPICDEDTPDPWMIEARGKFYLTFTLGDRVEVWCSPAMENFRGCQKSIVWRPVPGSPWSDLIWAPEIHYLSLRWYIFVSGAQPRQGNSSHRTLVLRSDNQDPMEASSWSFLGPLKNMPDHWAIDATVFSPFPNELYCCYSGWPLGDQSDTQQNLFLIKLASPEMAIPDSMVCISQASLTWERCEGGRRGINEGPTWVDMSPAFRGIVYSASGSWTNEYKLGLLPLIGRDVLNKGSWMKKDTPFLMSDNRAPYGPGHASFLRLPQQPDQIYCVYHGTQKPDEGWRNRKARAILLHSGHFSTHAQTLFSADLGVTQHTTLQDVVFPRDAGFPSFHTPIPQQKRPGFFNQLRDIFREI